MWVLGFEHNVLGFEHWFVSFVSTELTEKTHRQLKVSLSMLCVLCMRTHQIHSGRGAVCWSVKAPLYTGQWDVLLGWLSLFGRCLCHQRVCDTMNGIGMGFGGNTCVPFMASCVNAYCMCGPKRQKGLSLLSCHIINTLFKIFCYGLCCPRL